MERESPLTIQEALTRPMFQDARVVAGKDGLGRRIRWVHILETSLVETLIHGQEMILTTGISFNLGAGSSITFMQQLIRQNAACLCIEIGPYFEESEISEELIALADRHHFPLIIFPHTVRYVDITQDLHSLIINRHHQTLGKLEALTREFYRLTLSSQGTSNVLKLLHQSADAQAILRPLQGKTLFAPSPPLAEQESLNHCLDKLLEELDGTKPDAAPIVRPLGNRQLVLKPVGALDQTWAYLVLLCADEPKEYEFLLLDSASLSIAQALLRSRYMEERKLYSENMWVDELLKGRLRNDQDLKSHVGPEFRTLDELGYRVCLIEFEQMRLGDAEPYTSVSPGDREALRFHLTLLLRGVFERHGFRPLLTLKNNRLAVLALDLQPKSPARQRFVQALEALADARGDDLLKHMRLIVGISQPRVQLKNAYAAYEEAVQALALQPAYRKSILFYEELGVFQLLLDLNDGRKLQAFVRNYLGPLIHYDQTRGSELLLTLKVFLDFDGSKQLAAQKLFIVRQSLYYRLEKIAELLGEDFMTPEKRIAIQVALRAYQLLHPGAFTPARSEGSSAMPQDETTDYASRSE